MGCGSHNGQLGYGFGLGSGYECGVGDYTYTQEKWKCVTIMAEKAVTTSGDVGLHKGKCANREVGSPPHTTIWFRDRILYLFSFYHPTLLDFV